MKKLSSSRSELLLMEIILSILFFSLASAVCLQLFVKASLLGRDTAELDMAVRCAVSAAELLNQAGDPQEEILELFPESCVLTEEGITLLLDEASWSVIIYGDSHSTEIYRLEGVSYHPLIPSDLSRKGGTGAA